MQVNEVRNHRLQVAHTYLKLTPAQQKIINVVMINPHIPAEFIEDQHTLKTLLEKELIDLTNYQTLRIKLDEDALYYGLPKAYTECILKQGDQYFAAAPFEQATHQLYTALDTKRLTQQRKLEPKTKEKTFRYQYYKPITHLEYELREQPTLEVPQ